MLLSLPSPLQYLPCSETTLELGNDERTFVLFFYFFFSHPCFRFYLPLQERIAQPCNVYD